MSFVDQLRANIKKRLDEKNLFTNFLDYAESKTKVSKEHLFYGWFYLFLNRVSKTTGLIFSKYMKKKNQMYLFVLF
jgi:hypothetical protein